MGWHLDGKVTAVVGTHTHVQTADERILPKGTAYLTDVGMTGPHDSVIGVEIEAALGRFLTGMPARFETATGNPRLNAVIIEADETTGRAIDIERLSYGRRPGGARREIARPSSDLQAASKSAVPPMSDLFDLPFEDERAVERARSRRRARRPAPRGAAFSRVTELTVRVRDLLEAEFARSGSRASSRTAGCGTPATSTSR